MISVRRWSDGSAAPPPAGSCMIGVVDAGHSARDIDTKAATPLDCALEACDCHVDAYRWPVRAPACHHCGNRCVRAVSRSGGLSGRTAASCRQIAAGRRWLVLRRDGGRWRLPPRDRLPLVSPGERRVGHPHAPLLQWHRRSASHTGSDARRGRPPLRHHRQRRRRQSGHCSRSDCWAA
jgi:hypothetical protein